jgi:L-fuculose-phosphate aldolase
MTNSDARGQLVQVYRELARLRLITGSSGNLSARIGGGMLITASGATPETISAAGLVAMTLDGDAGGQARPSSEWEMHATIYQAFPEAAAIVHTHADACTALACLGEGLPAFHYEVAGFGGDDVRCTPYVTFGTTELALTAAAALSGRTACLLANHGMICHGPSPAAALASAITLERLVRQYLLARAAGIPRLLDGEQIEAARIRYRSYGPTTPLR